MEKIISRRIDQFTKAEKRVGATYVEGQGTYIRLWAPEKEHAEIEFIGGAKTALAKGNDGYFTGHFSDVKPGTRYYFHIDGKRIPDPASRFQPEGVRGPSEILDEDFSWTDKSWASISSTEWVIYEIHPGTFSEKHNFDGVIDDLPRLKELGINCLEIMPVSQFSGGRNWGYDGVFPHSVQNTYGGPEGLKRLVDTAHAQGFAIILDVVYNHIGPEGNVLFGTAPYTQTKYATPWGDALNYDGEYSDDVRRYFLQTVWQWLTEYHFDGLRLDAVQTILDTSPIPFLQEVSLLKKEAEKQRGQKLVLIAETDMNDPRVLEPREKNGMGFDGHWADDLHHTLHVTLTGETSGYYSAYTGGAEQLAKIYNQGVAYAYEYSPFHKRFHGRGYDHIEKHRLIVETQNHDQVGNRMMGERLSQLVDFEKLKLAAAAVLLSPFMPFLFMGEEFASEQPFLYFISHEDPKLLEAVRKGRANEWKSFGWDKEPPDPGAEETFNACVLKDKKAFSEKGKIMQSYYRNLIALSKSIRTSILTVSYNNQGNFITLNYKKPDDEKIVVLSFNSSAIDYTLSSDNSWECILNSASFQPGQEEPQSLKVAEKVKIAPYSAQVFQRI